MELCGLGGRRERQGIEVHGIGSAPVKCGMRSAGVEEVDIASEAAARLADGVVDAQVNSSYLIDRHSRSTKTLCVRCERPPVSVVVALIPL